jgi:non-lysosomal glucosylceramidase
MRIGQRTADSDLIAKALKLAEEVAYQTYDNQNNGYAFATAEGYAVDSVDVAHFPAYARARSVWSLLDAVAPIR